MAKPKKKLERPSDTHQESNISIKTDSPLVFISHDTRDADLAEAFGNLLTDASGGVLQSFRSSDRKGTAGIEFGAEWYAAIMSKLSDATDVVALLTSHSLERPWILYEAGVAKGKLDTTVLGLAINIPLEKTNSGPFAQFQNCADDEDSLTKLVLQLIRRNPQASPREEAVRRQVQAFQTTVKDMAEKRAKSPQAIPKLDENAVAKMFEEVKILVRDLPDRVSIVTGETSLERRRRPRFEPAILDEILHISMRRRSRRNTAVGLLIVFSYFRETQPWLYELALQLYVAVTSQNPRRIEQIRRDFREAYDIILHSPLEREMRRSKEDDQAFYFFHLFVERFDDLIPRFMSSPKAEGSASGSKE